jgi:hypothetical protein
VKKSARTLAAFPGLSAVDIFGRARLESWRCIQSDMQGVNVQLAFIIAMEFDADKCISRAIV